MPLVARHTAVRRCLTLGWLAAFALATRLSAQDTLYFPPTDRIAIRAMKSVPAIDLVPGVHVRTIVGATASFSYGEFDSAGVAPLHHHTREQTDVGLTGLLEMALGDKVEPLGVGAGVIVPPNVRHSIANRSAGVKTVIEFHTVRRPDLVPPRPALTFPSAPEPAPVAQGRTLVSQMDKGDGATITGETCTMRWRRVRTSVDLHPARTSSELFVYVVRGDGTLAADGKTARVGAGMLVIIPAGVTHVELRPAGIQ